MVLFDVRNLTYTYPECAQPALSDISFSVNAGEFVLLCGRSGCGKTTLLSHLKPVMTPFGKRNGEILFEGRDINSLSLNEQSQKIGFVMQNPHQQIATDKVWHEIAFGLENLGTDTEKMHRQVADIAYFFGIDKWFDRDINTLSGGQKQLVNLASVMAMHPDVLILDEPTSQLDPVARDEFLSALYRINTELGTTVIISEHRTENIFRYADRVIFMDGGRTLYDETVRKFACENISSINAYLPVSSQVYRAVCGYENVPYTVKSGREWLTETEKHTVTYINNKSVLTENAVEIKNLCFRYGRNLPDIIKNCSFTVPEKCIFSVVGGNGRGKSTLMKVICGALKQYDGKVVLNGRKAVCLPQESVLLFSADTVKEELLQMTRDEEKINRIVKLCGIENILGSHPYDISAGQQQCAALAKLILTDADIFLLDEITKGLDPIFKNRLAGILRSLCSEGKTIVMVSHDLEFCALYSDYVGMFFDRTVTGIRPPQEFFSENDFYTTAGARLSKGIIENAVTSEDIIRVCAQEN